MNTDLENKNNTFKYTILCCYCLCTKSYLTLVIPRTATHQAPLSMWFPRQEYWNELPFPTPEDLPDPGIKPESAALHADSLPLSYQQIPYTKASLCFYPWSGGSSGQVGESGGESHIADPHYSWIPFLQIHLLAKIDLQPLHQYSLWFCGHWSTCTGQGKMWVTQVVPSWGWMKGHSVLLSQLILQTGILSIVSLVPCFLYIFVFLLLFKRAPSIVLKCCLVFLRARRLLSDLWRKHTLDKLPSGINYRVVGHEWAVDVNHIYEMSFFKQEHT